MDHRSAINDYNDTINKREASRQAKLREQQEAKTNEKELQKAQREAEQKRRRDQTQSDLDSRNKNLRTLREKLKKPQILIQDISTNSSRNEWCELGRTQIDLKEALGSFNQVLLRFGTNKVGLLALLLTQSIGLYWVWASLGLDAVGGNTAVTIVVAIMILVAIDIIGLVAVSGTLASLENFMSDHRYHKLIEIAFTIGFAVGLICFFANAILRVMEVGI